MSSDSPTGADAVRSYTGSASKNSGQSRDSEPAAEDFLGQSRKTSLMEHQSADEGTTLLSLGERGVIEQARRHAGRRRAPLLLGIGDDAALLTPPPNKLLSLTCDMLVEGVHFRRDWSTARQIGGKAAAVNLSDIAAMGGEPAIALVSLAAPGETRACFVDEFFAGLTAELAAYGCQLAGGDTVASPGPVVVDVTVAGFQEAAVRRRGARAGDVLVLTGPVGGAAVGLALLEAGSRFPGSDKTERALLAAQLSPHARVREGRALARYAHAMTDLSDGLGTALSLLTEDRGLGARLDREQIPVAAGLRQVAGRLQKDPDRLIIDGGEEYELLAAVAPRRVPALWRTFARLGLVLYPIGEVTASAGLFWREAGRETRIERAIFEHFRLGRKLEEPPRT